MHPEIMRELTAQHGRDLRERAQRAQRARTAGRALRGLRRRGDGDGDGEFVAPAIPDYVDGSFQAAGDEAASHVPAAHRAG